VNTATQAKVISTEYTPNPNALKFNLNIGIVPGGAVTYSKLDDAKENRLATYLLNIPHVNEIFMMDNFITVTQDGEMPWDALVGTVKPLVEEHFEPVTIQIKKAEAGPGSDQPWETLNVVEQVRMIESLLDDEIRPALAGDGGGLEVVDLDGFQLKIHYQGACGTCPSSISGTLMYIENLVRERLDSRISVTPT